MTDNTKTIPAAVEKARLLAIHSAGASRDDRFDSVEISAPVKIATFRSEDRAAFLCDVLFHLNNSRVWADNDEITVEWTHITKDGNTVYPQITVA